MNESRNEFRGPWASWLREFSGKPLLQQQWPGGEVAFAFESVAVAAGFEEMERDGNPIGLASLGEFKAVPAIDSVVRGG